MNAHFNAWNCPHCAASDFRFVGDGVFQCAYCDGKTDFRELSPEVYGNRRLGAELKAFFQEKIDELQRLKAENAACVREFSAKASQDKLGVFSVVCLLLSAFLFLGAFTSPILALFALPPMIAYFPIKRYRVKMRRLYQPLAAHYASEVVKCDEELNSYTRLLSKFAT